MSEKKTRIPETEKLYKKKGLNLYKTYINQHDKYGHDFKRWAYDKASSVVPATWRMYKAALVFCIKTKLINHSQYEQQKLIDILDGLPEGICVPRKESTNTSRMKYKRLPEKTYLKLQNKLLLKKGKRDEFIYHWLESIHIVGARPTEWSSLKISRTNTKSKKVIYSLVFKNAKNTNGRSFADTRTVNLIDPSKRVLDHILYTRDFIKESLSSTNGDFLKFHKSIRERLLVVNKSLFSPKSKHITLYSARHQFEANMKKDGKSLVEIAALMGHGSVETANCNYARKSVGRKHPCLIQASPKDINLVIDWNQGKKYKLSYKNTAQLNLEKVNG